jgi:hypothetical protein
MRMLYTAAIAAGLSAGVGAAAQTMPKRLENPKINTQPVDHCADINSEDDCTVRGQARAAQKACIANGFADAVGFHWRSASGTAMHYVTEYDMHAGEVGGHWVSQPTTGTFDWIACRK